MTKQQQVTRPRPMIYAVTDRYSDRRMFSSRREAERYAAAERRDGWLASVEDMRADTSTATATR